MGRVVKGARVRDERYQLGVPPIVLPMDRVEPDEPVFQDQPLVAGVPPAATPAEPAAETEAIGAQARRLLDDAAREAEALVAEAQARARALLDDAAARADAIAQDARVRAHDEGYHAGREAADREMNEMLATMRGLVETARVERHKLIEQAEPELVRLALGIAERVLHQQVALDRGVVVEMAKTAIVRLIERDTVTVRVNPADLERVRTHRDELIALGDIRNLRVIEDKRVDRGGVVIETDAGTIDARVATQLEQARKVLHLEEDVVVEPAPAELVTKTDFTTARAS